MLDFIDIRYMKGCAYTNNTKCVEVSVQKAEEVFFHRRCIWHITEMLRQTPKPKIATYHEYL